MISSGMRKSSNNNYKCGLPAFLLFLRIQSSTPAFYVVTEFAGINGVYEEVKEPELHYKDYWSGFPGHYYFLYTDSRRPQTWILGHGKTLSTAYAVFRAPARDGRPAVTQWSYVWGDMYRSREGKEQGDPEPSLRVVGVETNSTGEEVASQLRGGKDIVTEEYIICKLNYSNSPTSRHRPWDHLQIINKRSNESCHPLPGAEKVAMVMVVETVIVAMEMVIVVMV